MQKKKNNSCSGCGKPVYFAERKTSLGKDWHPSCLKCQECGKVLSPGQHAEHKGIPYCHIPCYSQLFGPQLFRLGSNVTSPANFKKPLDSEKDNQNHSFHDDSPDGLKWVDDSPDGLKLKQINNSLAPVILQPSNSNEQSQKHIQNRISTGCLNTRLDNGFVGKNSLDLGLHDDSGTSGLHCELQSLQPECSPVAGTQSDAERLLPSRTTNSKIRGAEHFQHVQSYNEHHNKQGQELSIVEEDGNVHIYGSLHIYWGLHKPIMLKQYDDVPSLPMPWKRFSVITDNRELQILSESLHESFTDSPKSSKGLSSTGFHDSVLSSSMSDIVMRLTHIKKSNTMAYKGDCGNKWKRASINGHIYNYDTSVFTPVFGSCTSVTVNNKMTVLQVISTLLEKFKVENEASEYNLYTVTEKEGEKLLKDTDIPLLERLVLGPTDTVKIFIRDRPNKIPAMNPANIPNGSSPTTKSPVEEMHLPEEVEQLINIPVPVLQGILEKFHRDEEIEIQILNAKYERVRKTIQQIIEEKKARHK